MPGTSGSIGNGILGEYFLEREYKLLGPKKTRKRPKFQPCLQVTRTLTQMTSRSERVSAAELISHHISPRCDPQVTRTLTQLTSRSERVSAAELQAAVQPLVRGCPLLSAQLTSLIDSETPAAELTRREADFQTAALDAESAETEEFEEVTELEADEPDPYGTERCPCGCHETAEDVRFTQRRRHCERCGLRFMAGRVYLQTGKVGTEMAAGRKSE